MAKDEHEIIAEGIFVLSRSIDNIRNSFNVRYLSQEAYSHTIDVRRLRAELEKVETARAEGFILIGNIEKLALSKSVHCIFMATDTLFNKRKVIENCYKALNKFIAELKILEKLAEKMPFVYQEVHERTVVALKEETLRIKNAVKESELKFNQLMKVIKFYRKRNEHFLHQLNKRFSFRLDLNCGGKIISLPVKLIFNLSNISIEHGLAEYEAEELAKDISSQSPSELCAKIMETIKAALTYAFMNSQEQLNLFAMRTEVTVVIRPMFKAAGKVNVVEGKGGTLNLRDFASVNELRFDINFGSAFIACYNREAFTDLTRIIIHEINHLYDKHILADSLGDIIRKEGLARLSEIAFSKEKIKEIWDKTVEINMQFIHNVNVWGLKSMVMYKSPSIKYLVGVFMWMQIFLYFLKRKMPSLNAKKCLLNPKSLYGLLSNENVQKLLNIYLRTFRNVDQKNFIKLQDAAARSFGMESYYEIFK